MHNTQYNGYENGRSRPSGPTLERIASALGTTVESLLHSGQLYRDNLNINDNHSFADWDELRVSLQKVTAERLGIAPDRVLVDIRVN
jgi:transcriptional regulator with XRE-family HTH domain